ncbi:MAG: hypothetical protein WD512_03125 [Candidatus Paceibacterota bacterium]
MIYYVIRHKATGELMHQCKRGKGYSWWNPSNPQSKIPVFLNIPRLFESSKQAQRAISQWKANPNGRRSISQSYSGEFDDIVDFKDDGRKKDDLEIRPLFTRLGIFRLEK